jgi:hypothetical protein
MAISRIISPTPIKSIFQSEMDPHHGKILIE